MCEATSSQPGLVWYRLVDSETGQPYKATNADYVLLLSSHCIAQFRDAVQAKWDKPGYLKDTPAGALTVYKNKDAFENRNAVDYKEEPLKSSALLNALGTTEDDALIVVVPTDMSMSGPVIKDISTKLYQDLTQPFPREPDIYELKSCLSSDPLVQIPLLRFRYDVVTRYCFEPAMEKFKIRFRRSSAEDCSIAHSLETLPNMPFKPGTGESKLYHFIDFFMIYFLEAILASPNLKIVIDRNTGDISRTTLAKCRPDFLFYVNSFLFLRGEEKKDKRGFSEALGELTSKLKTWNSFIFGRMNYIFGYVLAGEAFRLYAIGPEGVIVEISNELDLQCNSDRFELFFLLINLARVIKTVLDRFPTETIMLYREMPRDNCTIEIRDEVVVKRIRVLNQVWDLRFQFLKKLYTSLSQHSVPCVPKCTDIRKCSKKQGINQSIELTILPLGYQTMPHSLKQLLIALKCVLLALDGVHKLGYAHRDVRWPNLLYVSDNYWMLIDFENAEQGDDALFQNDIRSVGNLIDDWNLRNPTLTALLVGSFRDVLVSEIPPSTSAALNLLANIDISTDLVVKSHNA